MNLVIYPAYEDFELLKRQVPLLIQSDVFLAHIMHAGTTVRLNQNSDIDFTHAALLCSPINQ